MTDQTPPPQPDLTPLEKGQGARLVLVVVAVVVAIGLGVGGVLVATKSGKDGGTASDAAGTTSTKVAVAPCGQVITKPTDQNQNHVTGSVDYADAPPAFGQHAPVWVPFGRAFYSSDRPAVEELVHNLEHGFTIAWYDDTAAEDEDLVADLTDLAESFQSEQERFIAAPWHDSDGAPFPDGMHVALTRWSADPADPGDQTKQRGNWMYCGGLDEDAIRTFVATWPNSDSAEPNIPLEQ